MDIRIKIISHNTYLILINSRSLTKNVDSVSKEEEPNKKKPKIDTNERNTLELVISIEKETNKFKLQL